MDKRTFLKQHDWETLWSDDNWVEIGVNNPDWCGVSTDEAFEIEMKRERQRVFDKEHNIVR